MEILQPQRAPSRPPVEQSSRERWDHNSGRYSYNPPYACPRTEIEKQIGRGGMRLLKSEGVAALSMRQLASRCRSSKAIVAAHFDALPVPIAETHTVFG